MAVSQSLSFSLVEQQYSSSGNKTLVRFIWTSTQSGESFNNNTRTAQYTVTQNGSSQTYYVNYTLPKNATATIVDTTLTVDHDASGYGSLTVDTYMNTGISAGVVEKSATYTAPRIAPKSTLVVSDGTLGTAQNVGVYRKNKSFTHTITYTCGSASGTICTKSSAESISWTPPINLAEQAPSANSVPVTFELITYEGNNEIGRDSKSITCAIPYTNTYVPVLSFAPADATGYATTYGAYIQGKSKLKLDITTYGAYGAWIVACKTVFDGSMYTGTSVVSNPIINSGTLPIKVVVTDSRARVTEVNTTINVLTYQRPKINSFTATRCNADGTANTSGSYFKAAFSATVSSLNNKNTARYWVGYKKAGSTKTAVEQTNLANQYSVNSSYVFPADESSYDVIFTVTDAFGTATQTITGAAVKKVWSMLKSGNEIVGMAFGKTAEEEGILDIGWKMKFSGGMASKVLPSGTDLNTAVIEGTYGVIGTAWNYTNIPELTNGYLEVMAYSQTGIVTIILQRFTSIWNTFNQYERRRNTDGSWSAWVCTRGDFVVEQGTKDGWTYRKWNSGLAECWKTLTHVTTVATSWNAMYVGNATQRQNYPFSFIEKPVEIVTLTSGGSMGFIYPEQSGHGVNGASASARYNVASLSSITTNATFYFNYQVTGKWR